MRESFILIILSLVIAVRCSTSESYTYNFYKDHMRARSADSFKINPVMRKLLNTYESPEEYNMPPWLPEYIKRASDINKKLMLSKLKNFDEKLEKRTSKAALSLMLQSKQSPEPSDEEHSCYSGK